MSTYYVSTVGNDANTKTQAQDINTPWLTWSHAIGQLVPGDTVLIRGGTYNENLNSFTTSFNPGGTSYAAGQVITISGYASEAVTLNGYFLLKGSDYASYALCPHYYIFQNFKLNHSGLEENGISIRPDHQDRNANHIKFINVEITSPIPSSGNGGVGIQVVGLPVAEGATSQANDTYIEFIDCNVHHWQSPASAARNHGFYISTGNNTIDGCQSHDNDGYGIQLYDGNVGASYTGNVVKNCVLYSNGIDQGGGMNVIINHNALVYNNIIYSNASVSGAGIVVYASTNIKVYNNTIYGNAVHGIALGEFGTTSGCLVKNNICKNNGQWGIYLYPSSDNTTVQFNDTQGNAFGTISNNGSGNTVSNNITTDPLFVNASSQDFHLQTGSPCRDTGTSTAPDVTTDFDGNSRPQNLIYDMGAYEYIVIIPPSILPVFEPFTGTGALSVDWSSMLRVPSSTLSRSSDQCKGDLVGADCMAFWTSASFNSSQYSQCTIATGLAAGTHYAELLVRASGSAGTAQCYGVVTDSTPGSGGTFFFKMLSNTITGLGGISTPAANGNRIRLTISTDNKLKFWIDSGTGWTEIQTVDLGASPEIISGAAGIGVYDETTNTMRLDTWEGGNYTPGQGFTLLGIGS